MKYDQLCIFTFLVVAILYFKSGSCISCYHCNSAYDPRCGDPFDPYTLGIVNCSLLAVPEHLRLQGEYDHPFFCRKIIQKVFQKKRIVRGCGYIAEERSDCYRRTGTFEVDSTYCACVGDNCNDSTCLKSSTVLVTSLISVWLLLINTNFRNYLL